MTPVTSHRTSAFARLVARRRPEDDGFALVTVLGIMAVCGLLIMMMVAGASATVGSTTQTRAKVQSRAAAEAGIDVARQTLHLGTCSGGSVTGALPDGSTYDVLLYASASGTPSRASHPRCPDSADRAVLAVSTGEASWNGIGDSRGDKSIVEALLTEFTPPPAFNQAVFIGGGGTGLNSGWNLDGEGPTASGEGSLLTTGDFNCTNTGTGAKLSVIASGDANLSSSCSIVGDIFIKGDLEQCQGSTIKGNVYVQGKAAALSGCKITGDLVVKGDISGYQATVTGSVVSTSGTVTGYTVGKMGGGLTVAKPIPNWGDFRTVLGTVTCSPVWSTPVTNNCSGMVKNVGVQPAPEEPASGFDQPMPSLTADSLIQGAGGGFSLPWSSFIRDSYLAHGATPTAPNRFTTAKNYCKVKAPATVGPDSSGDSLNGPIVIGKGSTVIDVRDDCETLDLLSTKMVLNGDLTLLTNNVRFINELSVVRGPDAPTHKSVKLRIIVPRANDEDTCSTPVVPYTITYAGSTKLNVASEVSTLFYSAGAVEFSNSVELYGQLYTCRMPDARNDVKIHYRQVEDLEPPSPDDERFVVRYVRDVK